MPASITLRSVQDTDAAFLLAVYASTRAAELSLVNWSTEQKQDFVEMQFNAQKAHYARYYPAAEYSIILRDGAPIGRLIVDRSGPKLLLMDIVLLPEHCNQGIGTGIIHDLMAEADQAGKPVRLHVESFNPARRLYQRLGFYPVGESGIYYEMEWKADGAAMPDEKGEVI